MFSIISIAFIYSPSGLIDFRLGAQYLCDEHGELSCLCIPGEGGHTQEEIKEQK